MVAAAAFSLAPVRASGSIRSVSIVRAPVLLRAAIGVVASLLGGLVAAIRFRHEAG